MILRELNWLQSALGGRGRKRDVLKGVCDTHFWGGFAEDFGSLCSFAVLLKTKITKGTKPVALRFALHNDRKRPGSLHNVTVFHLDDPVGFARKVMVVRNNEHRHIELMAQVS